MSSDVVIRADGLGKKYVIGHQSNQRYTALRDVVARSAKGFARTAGDMLRGRPIYSGDELEEFWALKDVSFDVKRGDVVGIIGRNGAGKSTLLKILSRITEPSEGRVEIKGRVASLLEVGTGFHPELTGRENIYLNGSILGMTRAEIQRKFDEIVDFADVERFLDTPVKRYSSGMYVRLAFAVAAHLEPEILIVDEVLAVGDAEFQKKCLGKMQDVASDGRTVLLVSHNVSAVGSLCKNCLWLDRGQVRLFADRQEAMLAYITDGSENAGASGEFSTQSMTGSYRLIPSENGTQLRCELAVQACEPVVLKAAHFFLQTSAGARAAIIDFLPIGSQTVELEVGTHQFIRIADIEPLSSDIYVVGLHVVTNKGEVTDWSAGKVLRENDGSRYAVEYQGPLTLNCVTSV
jgi:ABC-type polysaccharide/polyol phosphate transport system ATPase subunit